jgi:hypothetical protein
MGNGAVATTRTLARGSAFFPFFGLLSDHLGQRAFDLLADSQRDFGAFDGLLTAIIGRSKRIASGCSHNLKVDDPRSKGVSIGPLSKLALKNNL